MNKLNFIKRFRISISSIKNYKYLLVEKFSKAIIYALIISLALGMVQAIQIVNLFGESKGIIEEFLMNEDYKFSLENGILEFENSPIELEIGSIITYIDTDTELEDIESIRSKIVHKYSSYVILKDGIYLKEDAMTQTYNYKDIFGDVTIDNDKILDSMSLFGVIKYVVGFIFIILSVLSFVIYILIVSVLAVVLSKINMMKLKYKDILKLSIYTSTLAILIDSFIGIGALKIIISGVYLILVLRELRILTMEQNK